MFVFCISAHTSGECISQAHVTYTLNFFDPNLCKGNGKVRQQTQMVGLQGVCFFHCAMLHLGFLLFVFFHLPKLVVRLVI